VHSLARLYGGRPSAYIGEVGELAAFIVDAEAARVGSEREEHTRVIEKAKAEAKRQLAQTG